MKKLALAVLATLLSLAAHAGQTTATIDRILLYDGGMLVYIYPTGGVVGAPGCHGSNGNYYSYSMSRPMAKEYLAALMAAQVRGVMVTFYGKGACLDQSVSETLDYFSVPQ